MPLHVAGNDKTAARRLQRLAARGRLRRLYPGIYSDDLLQPMDAIVRRELLALCALIARGSIISHRSAAEGGRPTAAGSVFLTGPNRRDFDLPGVKLRMTKGAGPLDTDIRIPTFGGDAFMSGQARALLENLSASRGPAEARRTLGAKAVQAWLDRFIDRDVGDATNKLRGVARSIAKPLGLAKEFQRLDSLIDALLDTRTTRHGGFRDFGRREGDVLAYRQGMPRS